MSSVLLCCHKQKSIHLMKSFLNTYGYHDIVPAIDVNAAHKQISIRSFDLVVIDLPFTMNHQELSFLLTMNEICNAAMIAIIKEREANLMRDKLAEAGVFTLIKPIQQDIFTQLLSFIKAANCRCEHLIKRQEQLIKKIQEIKLVDRAKCLLIEHTFLSEGEAHKQIEKAAMNDRVTRGVVAKKIIDKYGN